MFDDFPLLKKCVYLNTAYVGLMSKSLYSFRRKYDLDYINGLCLRINDFLSGIFKENGIITIKSKNKKLSFDQQLKKNKKTKTSQSKHIHIKDKSPAES